MRTMVGPVSVGALLAVVTSIELLARGATPSVSAPPEGNRGTNGHPRALLPALTNLHSGANPLLAGPSAAGVYKTEPYACIVVVPGEHIDSKVVRSPGEKRDAMPQYQPELRFIPRKTPAAPEVVPRKQE